MIRLRVLHQLQACLTQGFGLRQFASISRKFRAGGNMGTSSATFPFEIQKLILDRWSKFLTAGWRLSGKLTSLRS
jgi:hypothetical protein